jgi:hypothetical protein
MAQFSRLAGTEVTAMSWGYYAYVIGDDGHIVNRIDVLCDNDEEAIRCAERLVDGLAIELWQEKRRIAVFQPKD